MSRAFSPYSCAPCYPGRWTGLRLGPLAWAGIASHLRRLGSRSMSRGVDYGSLLFILQLTLMKRHSWIDPAPLATAENYPARSSRSKPIIRSTSIWSLLSLYLCCLTKERCGPATTLYGNTNPTLVIPTEAKWRDLRCAFPPANALQVGP